MERTSGTPNSKTGLKKLLCALFWVTAWQVAAMIVDRGLFLASPAEVLGALLKLVFTGDFWLRVGSTFTKIACGFLLASAVGTALAALSARFSLLRELLAPPMKVINATPIVSFIILALIWINSRMLSTFIAFLMVLPVLYINTLAGIDSADGELLEAAKVFGSRPQQKFRFIYLPAVMPHYASACKIALGMSWKAGIAAEVIGLPSGTIGERLYEAKLYLNTAELFAYTITIILVSALFERLYMLALKRADARLIGRRP